MTVRDLEIPLASTPAWLLFRGSLEEAAARGTILFWHGFTACKEVHEKELASLAAHGYLAVGLDAVGHGARRYADFDARFAGSGPAFDVPFLEAVRATAAETPAVVEALRAHGAARPERLGLAGISMGALVAYRAALVERRATAAACLLGSPRWRQPWPESPHLHAGRFFPLALLSQCAGADQAVPPDAARDFHAQLAPLYRAAPERLRYVEIPGVGHFMPEPQWQELWGNVLAWFDRFLAGA
ncbi:MAG TPA: alpha/beta fold hydrolase [Polyangia bacterium]|jgi:hypothetical protein